jgi:hypothetical protein
MSHRSAATATMNLPPAPSASFAGTLTADEKLIDFDTTGKLFPFVSDRTAPELLKPCPGGAITAKAQQFLEIYRIDARFTGGEPPHGFEPVSDRAFGAVHDRTGRQRMLVLALGADIQLSRTQPIPLVAAFFTHKAVGPLLLEQILVTGIRI